jgi:hypothetical protein
VTGENGGARGNGCAATSPTQVGTVTSRAQYPDHIHIEIFALGIIICTLQGMKRNAGANPDAQVTGGEIL